MSPFPHTSFGKLQPCLVPDRSRVQAATGSGIQAPAGYARHSRQEFAAARMGLTSVLWGWQMAQPNLAQYFCSRMMASWKLGASGLRGRAARALSCDPGEGGEGPSPAVPRRLWPEIGPDAPAARFPRVRGRCPRSRAGHTAGSEGYARSGAGDSRRSGAASSWCEARRSRGLPSRGLRCGSCRERCDRLPMWHFYAPWKPDPEGRVDLRGAQRSNHCNLKAVLILTSSSSPSRQQLASLELPSGESLKPSHELRAGPRRSREFKLHARLNPPFEGLRPCRGHASWISACAWAGHTHRASRGGTAARARAAMDDSDGYEYEYGSDADLSQSDGDTMEFNTSAELGSKSSKVHV